MDRRYEWAAKYLLNVPLKEIAGEDADATTVGTGCQSNRATCQLGYQVTIQNPIPRRHVGWPNFMQTEGGPVAESARIPTTANFIRAVSSNNPEKRQ
jgi:hypothetical protein